MGEFHLLNSSRHLHRSFFINLRRLPCCFCRFLLAGRRFSFFPCHPQADHYISKIFQISSARIPEGVSIAVSIFLSCDPKQYIIHFICKIKFLYIGLPYLSRLLGQSDFLQKVSCLHGALPFSFKICTYRHFPLSRLEHKFFSVIDQYE